MPEPVATAATRWSGPFASLRNVRYRRLWLGSMAVFLGLRMHDVVLGWLVLELTDSPFFLGLADFTRYLPLLIFPLVGGLLAEKVDRRMVLLAVVALGATVTATVAATYHLGLAGIWLVLALELLSGSGFSIYYTVRQYVIAEVVDKRHLLNAFSLDFAGGSFLRVLAPTLAGMLITVIGIAGSLCLEAAAFAASLLMFGRLPLPKRERSQSRTGVWQSLREQWGHVRQDPTIFNLMVLSAVMIPFGMSYKSLMPAIARDVLGKGPEGLGMLVGASGVGAVVAALALAGGHDLKHSGAIVLWGAGLFGLGMILLALSRNFVLSMVLIAAGESMAAVYQTLYKVVIQERTPDEFRGRMTGMYVLVWGLLPLGSLLMGAVAAHWGPPVAVGMGGTICLLFTLGWGVFRSHLLDLA